MDENIEEEVVESVGEPTEITEPVEEVTETAEPEVVEEVSSE